MHKHTDQQEVGKAYMDAHAGVVKYNQIKRALRTYIKNLYNKRHQDSIIESTTFT